MKLSTLFMAALASLILTTGFASAAPQPAERNIATFSVVAYNPATGEVGVAVQSKFFAVGSVVPYAEAGVGAIASQAFGNTTFGPLGLGLMAEGHDLELVIMDLLREDADRERRQVGLVRVGLGAVRGTPGTEGESGADWSQLESGEALTYTGSECMDWAGGLTGMARDGIIFSVQGNILTGADVVQAMHDAMADPEQWMIDNEITDDEIQMAVTIDDMAGRLMLALAAGQSRGGDSRGMQSSALLIKQAGMGYGGYNDLKYDLRVDDAVDPFHELARLINVGRPFAMGNEAYTVLYAGDFERARELFLTITMMDPLNGNAFYNLACACAMGGDIDAGFDYLNRALELDPMMLDHALQDSDLDNLHSDPRWESVAGRSSGVVD